MGIIDDPNLKIWSETKEKLSYFGNSGQTGGSLWQGCLTTSLTEPSSLVRESGNTSCTRTLSCCCQLYTMCTSHLYAIVYLTYKLLYSICFCFTYRENLYRFCFAMPSPNEGPNSASAHDSSLSASFSDLSSSLLLSSFALSKSSSKSE